MTKGELKRHDEFIVCKLKEVCNDIMNKREFTRADIINAFNLFTDAIIYGKDPTDKKNTIRVYYRKGKSAGVTYIDCYNVISVGHIGNNSYKVLYVNENNEMDSLQIDKYLVVSIEGVPEVSK